MLPGCYDHKTWLNRVAGVPLFDLAGQYERLAERAVGLQGPAIGSTVAKAAPSALSALDCWVEFTELDAGILGSELPLGPGGGGVTPVPPGLDVALQRRPVAHPVRQVAAEGAQ